ncbi:Ctr copper transporter family-domain-containing protein [Pestalotiopsis sp. NC0098]|nr:Ctr copper transporter family-domain-containing protein [Pestalotiopsis sp. NC0098]
MATATSTDMSGMSMTRTSAMSTSTSSMDMDMSSSTLMTSSEMAMVFFQSVTTPLFASAWTPTGEGSYAGTCIFLIVLAALHRVLHALKSVVFDAGQHGRARLMSEDGEFGKEASGAGSASRKIQSEWNGHPFRVATETARAVTEVIVGGIGYLLMLAVMTMNVGYFLSVLGGIFLGCFVAGRFGTSATH